jgi:hypothetical protein
MKIRPSFVSNSSTASFVIFGVEGHPNIPQPPKQEDYSDYKEHDRAYDAYCNQENIIYYGEWPGGPILGVKIAEGDAQELEGEMGLMELMEKLNNLSEIYDIPLHEFKIIVGSVYC